MPARSMTARFAGLAVALTLVASPHMGMSPGGADEIAAVGSRQVGNVEVGSIRVHGLEVEHQVNPLGIDVAQPRFGWVLGSDVHGALQSAYQIVVSTERDGPADVWDSGRTQSSRSFDLEYAGPPLQSRTRYYWKVRVWDAAQKASPWSQPAWFETAFLTSDEFQGDWIGAEDTMVAPSLDGANWIWYPEGDPADSAPAGARYFRRAFDLPAGDEITAAQFQLTTDDGFTLYVNGQEIASSPRVPDSWRTATIIDISAALHPGRNVIAIEAFNSLPGPAGLIGKLQVEGPGDPLELVTDGAWSAADAAADGWWQPDFDDSAWPAALEAAPYGSGPWGSSVTAPIPPEPLLRDEFSLDKPIESARVYVAGLGYYKLFLNGERIGDHELDPGFTVYDKTVLYATYDVTKALRRGDNAMGVSLGRGYFAMMRPDEWMASPWHSEPKLKLELDIEYEDGSTQRVVSDSRWKTAEGPTRAESLWFGEVYDARLERPGWAGGGYDDTGWRPVQSVAAPDGELRAQAFPPIKVTDSLPAADVTAPRDGVQVYDFGSPVAGWARVAMRGPPAPR